MSKLTGIFVFSLIPGIVVALFSIILSLAQNEPVTFISVFMYFLIGIVIGFVLVILRYG
ncbi:hypothetical protein [Salicibibacter halophilus]|nr:hypothetical protein [Salicibibacter halophilus]